MLSLYLSIVMPGLDPGIHVFLKSRWRVDGRVKPGHDDDTCC
jgi:hypothetical protein